VTETSIPVQLCTFRLDPYWFGIDVLAVQEVLRHQEVTPVPLAPPEVRGLINLRGQLVVAIDLARRLGLPARPAEVRPGHVVVRSPIGATSLLVDQVGDVQIMDPACFEATHESVRGVAREVTAGVFKLEQGLMLVLDVARAVVPAGLKIGQAA
jgi:purine-binding chemotaxis protein CheW